MAVDITDLREHIETDLPDDALTRLLNDAQADVEARFGDDAAIEAEVYGGGMRKLFFTRPISTITSVVEKEQDRSVIATLSANDYTVRHGGRTLERLVGRDNARTYWAPVVVVTYTPVPEEVIRDRVIIDLVKIGLTYEGMIHSQQVGDYQSAGSVDPKAYMRERENVMAQVSNRRGFRFV